MSFLYLFRLIKTRAVVCKRNFATTLASIPKDKATVLTWYSCGPTVYDDAHLGHARTYVCTDIIRRVLSVHFRLPIHFALGITDVDDKIIAKGRAFKFNTVNEYQQLTQNLENDFFKDMGDLNVLPPDAILRVTQHIDEIIAFIQVLIDKNHAYVAKDGVYFDFLSLRGKPYERFTRHEKIHMEEEQPFSSTTANGVNEIPSNITTKVNPKDFALWKVYPAEKVIAWDSPWGRGRPGWHIECSAMTYAHFGKSLDIHSGGIDLQFPHHTNEIAQSECHHCDDHQLTANTPDWVKTWIHTGHLHIDGRKMSKSLKNFISIRQYLESKITSDPADDFRIFCLMSRYSTSVTYSEQRIVEAAVYRKKVQQYLRLMESIRQKRKEQPHPGHVVAHAKPCAKSRSLTTILKETELTVHNCLEDDFNTPLMLRALSELLLEASTHATAVVINGENLAIEPLYAIEDYIIRTLNMLGLRFVSHGRFNEKENDKQRIQQATELLVHLRSAMRQLALVELKDAKKLGRDSGKENERIIALCKKLLALTDQTRSEASSKLGVQIEDLSDGSSVIKK